MDFDGKAHVPVLRTAHECAIDFCLNQHEVSVSQGRLRNIITQTILGKAGVDARYGDGSPA